MYETHTQHNIHSLTFMLHARSCNTAQHTAPSPVIARRASMKCIHMCEYVVCLSHQRAPRTR